MKKTNIIDVLSEPHGIVCTLNLEILAYLLDTPSRCSKLDFYTFDSNYARLILRSKYCGEGRGSQLCKLILDRSQDLTDRPIIWVGGSPSASIILREGGHQHMHFSDKTRKSDEKSILQIIQSYGSVRPIILFALPFRKALELVNVLDAERTLGLYIPIGGGLDIALGLEKPAPDVVARLQLEWLWRLFAGQKRILRLIKTIFNLIKLAKEGKLKREEIHQFLK